MSLKSSRVKVMSPWNVCLESEQVIWFLSAPNSDPAQPGLTVSPGNANAVTSTYDLLFSPRTQKHSKVIKFPPRYVLKNLDYTYLYRVSQLYFDG